MSNFLQKITAAINPPTIKSNLPTVAPQGQVPSPITLRNLELTKGLPPASIVYGAAAGAFVAFSLALMINHHWVDGLLTLLPAACFIGFAVHLMKGAQPKR